MILQNDPRIKTTWIHKSGCAFMSVLWYVNKKKRKPMGPSMIDAYHIGMLQDKCFNEKHLVIWDKAYHYMGMNVSVSFEEASYRLQPGEFAIGKWYNPKTGLTHFTAVDGLPGAFVCTYDPLGESVTVRDGYLKALRVFREVQN